jgi:hypothetical protein
MGATVQCQNTRGTGTRAKTRVLASSRCACTAEAVSSMNSQRLQLVLLRVALVSRVCVAQAQCTGHDVEASCRIPEIV